MSDADDAHVPTVRHSADDHKMALAERSRWIDAAASFFRGYRQARIRHDGDGLLNLEDGSFKKLMDAQSELLPMPPVSRLQIESIGTEGIGFPYGNHSRISAPARSAVA